MSSHKSFKKRLLPAAVAMPSLITVRVSITEFGAQEALEQLCAQIDRTGSSRFRCIAGRRPR